MNKLNIGPVIYRASGEFYFWLQEHAGATWGLVTFQDGILRVGGIPVVYEYRLNQVGNPNFTKVYL